MWANSHIPEYLVLFDGVCNLCDRSVQFIIRHDNQARFRFAALQSAYTKQLLQELPALQSVVQLDDKTSEILQTGSIVFICQGKIYTQSTAVIEILRRLPFPYKMANIFKVFPKSWRDPLYQYIARHRYAWYGKKNACMMPSPDLTKRFMDDGK